MQYFMKVAPLPVVNEYLQASVASGTSLRFICSGPSLTLAVSFAASFAVWTCIGRRGSGAADCSCFSPFFVESSTLRF